ncbi:hypothetical protein BVI2075_140018 [Burkholderia vietnamiensis]|nr:hypothetical protein BVI2075_140018 [Burkholderia vietnamiensis]
MGGGAAPVRRRNPAARVVVAPRARVLRAADDDAAAFLDRSARWRVGRARVRACRYRDRRSRGAAARAEHRRKTDRRVAPRVRRRAAASAGRGRRTARQRRHFGPSRRGDQRHVARPRTEVGGRPRRAAGHRRADAGRQARAAVRRPRGRHAAGARRRGADSSGQARRAAADGRARAYELLSRLAGGQGRARIELVARATRRGRPGRGAVRRTQRRRVTPGRTRRSCGSGSAAPQAVRRSGRHAAALHFAAPPCKCRHGAQFLFEPVVNPEWPLSMGPHAGVWMC